MTNQSQSFPTESHSDSTSKFKSSSARPRPQSSSSPSSSSTNPVSASSPSSPHPPLNQQRSHSRTSSLLSFPRGFWSSSDSEPTSKPSLHFNEPLVRQPGSGLGLFQDEIRLSPQDSTAPEWADAKPDSKSIKSSRNKTKSPSTSFSKMNANPSSDIPFPVRDSLTSSPMSRGSSLGSPSSLFSNSPSINDGHFSDFNRGTSSPATSIGNSYPGGRSVFPSPQPSNKQTRPRSRHAHSFNEGSSSPTRHQFRSSISYIEPQHEKEISDANGSSGLRSFSSLRNLAASAISWSSPRLRSGGISAPPPTSASEDGGSGTSSGLGDEEGGAGDLTETESNWKKVQRYSLPSPASNLSTSPQTKHSNSSNHQITSHSHHTSKKSIKLSRKRLDKAVSLAIEAAQVIEEEEIAREKAKLRRRERAKLQELKRQKEMILREELKRIQNDRVVNRGLGIEMNEGSNSGYFSSSMPTNSNFNSQNQLERNIQMSLVALSSDSEGLDEDELETFGFEEEEDENEDQDPNLALDLYISSLSHLLNALPNASVNSNSNIVSEKRINSKERISPTSRALSLFSSTSTSTFKEKESSTSSPSSSKTRNRNPSESLLETSTTSLLPEKQSLELKLQLEEALKKLGYDPSKEVKRLLTEKENQIQNQNSNQFNQSNSLEIEVGSTFNFEDGRNERIIHHHHHYMPYHLVSKSSNDSSQTFNHSVDPTTGIHTGNSDSRRQRTLSGFLATAALDLTLSMGSTAIAVASRGISSLAPISDTNHIKEIESKSPEEKNRNHSFGISSSPNLNLAMNLMGGAAKALLSSAKEVAKDSEIHQSSQDSSENQTSSLNSSSSSSNSNKEDSPLMEDLLITLAKSLKRSPLPTHLNQFFSILKSIDQKYCLKDKTFKLCLENGKKGFRYIDRNELHVKTVKGIWNSFHLIGKVWKAYDEEIGWNQRSDEVEVFGNQRL